MSDAPIRAVVEAIHSSPTQAVLFLSGGASQVFIIIYISVYVMLLHKHDYQFLINNNKWSGIHNYIHKHNKHDYQFLINNICSGYRVVTLGPWSFKYSS